MDRSRQRVDHERVGTGRNLVRSFRPELRRPRLAAGRRIRHRDPRYPVLDVRSRAEYIGERFWPSGATEDTGRSGHVPGAVHVPIDSLRREDGTLKDPDALRAVFEAAGVDDTKTVIAYCTIGNRASQAWFALKYVLGYPDVRVYYGSWVEWGKAPDSPIES